MEVKVGLFRRERANRLVTHHNTDAPMCLAAPALWLTLLAAAAMRLDKLIEVLLAIVVEELFSSLNIFSGKDKDPALTSFNLAIWSTGVIDIPGGISSNTPINNGALTCVKEVFAPAGIFLGLGELAAHIFDDTDPLRDNLLSPVRERPTRSLKSPGLYLLFFMMKSDKNNPSILPFFP